MVRYNYLNFIKGEFNEKNSFLYSNKFNLDLFIRLWRKCKNERILKSHLEEAKIRVAECKKMEKINETQQLDCENANEALLSKRTIKAF